MALSKQEKEQLANHFKGRDLYDPSKDPKQEPHDYVPQCLCGGGCARGMCSGGELHLDEGGVVSDVIAPFNIDGLGDESKIGPEGVDREKEAGSASIPPPVMPKPKMQAPTVTPPAKPAAPLVPQAAPEEDIASMLIPDAPEAKQKLNPDEMTQLVAALSQRPGIGETAMSALAGLGDAIIQGVGRAQSPGFQRQITETRAAQRQALAEALKAKYEMGYKGQEMAETARSHRANEAETEKARQLTAAQQELEARRLRQQEAHQTAEEQAKQTELQQKGSGLINAVERKLGFGPPLPQGQSGPVVVRTHEEYAALPKGTHYVDPKGKQGVKQ